MIGGEFDLSAGAMTGTTGLITGIMMTHYHVNVWVAVAHVAWSWRCASASSTGCW